VTEIDTSFLDSVVGYNLRRAAAKQRERFRSIFGPHDIRPVQLTVLTLIKFNMSLKQSDLGKALEMKRANVVTLLDELQQRGLIERRRSKGDRRSYELSLTTAGSRFTTRMLDLHAKLEGDLANSYGQDALGDLVALLRQFRNVDTTPDLG
jgi:DNA-binding MarR family transcriptional regulator